MAGENYVPDWLSRDEFDLAERAGHRLWLHRNLGEGPEALLVMCNPSTADDRKDDKTIESVERIFAHHGFGGVAVVNLFTKRETDQARLDCGDAASNYSNADEVLRRAFQEHETVVFAWGGPGKRRQPNRAAYERRANEVEGMVNEAGREPLCLGVTKDGFPRHPLYCRSDAPLRKFRERSGA